MVGIKNQSLFLSKIQHRQGMYELYLENPNFLKPISNGGSQMLEKSKQLAQTWWLRAVLIVRWSTKAKPLNWETRFWRKVTRRWIRFHVHNHQADSARLLFSAFYRQLMLNDQPQSLMILNRNQLVLWILGIRCEQRGFTSSKILLIEARRRSCKGNVCNRESVAKWKFSYESSSYWL